MTLAEIANEVAEGDLDSAVADFEVKLKENGEYGSYTILPVARVSIDWENKTILLED